MDIKNKIIENKELKDLTTFKIGGPARFFIELEKEEQLSKIQDWARSKDLEIFFLGGGSNVLVSDEGFDGLVVKLSGKDHEFKGNIFKGQAGLGLPWLVQETARQGLSGLEWAAGIPGITLGGAVRGNAGAFGSCMADSVVRVSAYNIETASWEDLGHKECCFAYRDSVFKSRPELLIWSVELKFESKNKKEIEDRIKENLEKRGGSQPKQPSAGSIFENIHFKELEKSSPSLADRARFEGVVKGDKVGVGWVIDNLDLKGKKMGGAQVSPEHANFIVNTGSATALDVITLISYIKQKVRQHFNLQLKEEIQYVGF